MGKLAMISGAPTERDRQRHEAEVLQRVAEVERAEALTLPPGSEIREHLLRSSTLYQLASATVLGVGLTPIPTRDDQ